VTELGQLIAWSVLAGLVLGARLLDTGPGRRFLRARFSWLAGWWAARQRHVSDVDEEYDELSVVLRRQQLSAHIARLRRIVATDESMSATRQIANRLAYRWLLREFEKTPGILPGMADDIDDRWTPSTYHPRHREAEVLEIGWRR
jgi:hypothetical protein